jgi:hypothetical protein
MPTPTRVLTNNYQDCQLIKMDLDDPKSPLVVYMSKMRGGSPEELLRQFPARYRAANHERAAGQ